MGVMTSAKDPARLACQTAPDLFLSNAAGKVAQARALCAPCPIQEKCLQDAMRRNVRGTWAGTTEKERRDRRKAEGITAQPSLSSTRVVAKRGRKPPPTPRRPEVALPPPAHVPGPVEVRHVAPTVAAPQTPYSPVKYDPRRPRITPSRNRRPERPPQPLPVTPWPPPSDIPAPQPTEPPAATPEPSPKCCLRCREPRTRADFYPNRDNPDGLAIWCKQCFAEITQRAGA